MLDRGECVSVLDVIQTYNKHEDTKCETHEREGRRRREQLLGDDDAALASAASRCRDVLK